MLHRELIPKDMPAAKLDTLRVLAYDTRANKLVNVSIPMWLLRLAPSNKFSFMKDNGIDFDSDRMHISMDDIDRRGPGLILDQVERRGSQVLVWTERARGPAPGPRIRQLDSDANPLAIGHRAVRRCAACCGTGSSRDSSGRGVPDHHPVDEPAVPAVRLLSIFTARGNLQQRVYALISDRLGAPIDGRILDIGTGNGILAIQLAAANTDAQVIGSDYWGSDWEYAQSVCEENARRAGVSTRVSFEKGTAANLPYADGTFAAVVSNLTFHEVKSEPQKARLVTEALRAVRPGGGFAFVDLFYDNSFYGPQGEIEAFVEHLALSRVELCPLTSKITLPKLLQHPRILGRAGILYGEK